MDVLHSLTDLPEEMKDGLEDCPLAPVGTHGEEYLWDTFSTSFDRLTPYCSSPFEEEEEEDGYSASLWLQKDERAASSSDGSTLACSTLEEDGQFDPTSSLSPSLSPSPSPSLSLTPPESPLDQLEVFLLDTSSTADDDNDETQQLYPADPLEQTCHEAARPTRPPYAAFTTPATLHRPGCPQALTVEEEERPIFEVRSHRLWPLPAGLLLRGLNNFIVVRLGSRDGDVITVGGRSRDDFQLPVIKRVVSSTTANHGWRAVPPNPFQDEMPGVPVSFRLCYEETTEEKNKRKMKGKKKEIPWTPVILHFGEHKVLAVVSFNDRDLDKRMFEMLSSAMTEELAATIPTLDIVLRLYESAELAYWMDKGLWDARKRPPRESQEPHQKKPCRRPQASTESYNGLQQQEAWARLFADQREDLIGKVTAAGTFSQKTWCLYWGLQKLRRKGILKLNNNTLLYLFLKENEVFRRAPHYVEWVLLPERKKLREEPYLSLLLLKRDGTRRIFRREAGKEEYVEGDLENRQYFSTTTLNRVLDEEGGDEFLQTGSSSSSSSSHNSITTQQRGQP